MATNKIDGGIFYNMLLGGAAVLNQNISRLNSLNVFPVADGDTGTNMYATIDGGLSAFSAVPSSIGEVASGFARAALLSARGNSGVILSQIFAGIAEVLRPLSEVTASELVLAYINGIKKSYSSVQNPTEGTILTVFRESAEYAEKNIDADSSVEDFYRLIVEKARESLSATPDLLPALREAGVVDSGGAGYLAIAEGMYSALLGDIDTASVGISPENKTPASNIDSFTRDSILEFGYCTEILLRLTSAKVDPDTFDIKTVLCDLDALHGESVVAYKEGDIIKVHVHTFSPGEILSSMQKYGEFLSVKVENMSLTHVENIAGEKTDNKKLKKKFAIVAVVNGEGNSALFKDIGADYIITGGQTSNPSVEEFVSAFESCFAENIIVLPNNKNIFLAAKGASEIYPDANVIVLETGNMMQGYAALSVINPGMSDMDMLVRAAVSAMEGVIDGEITRAVRDVNIDGIEIRAGEYMAISGGKILCAEESAETAVLKMLDLSDTDLSEIVTLFVGREVDTERRVELTEQLKDTYPELEIVVFEGGQEVYDYLIAIE